MTTLLKSAPFVVRDRHNKVVWREAECSRCQEKFEQYEVAPEWLELLKPHERSFFLVSCVVEEGHAFQPARCPSCTRKQLNP